RPPRGGPPGAPRGAACAAAEPSAKAAGGIGVRLLEAPTNRADDPRARTYIVDHLLPGTTISRRIEVSNSTDKPQRIALYPAAARISDDGFEFAAGRTANELTSWAEVDPPVLELAAGTDSFVTATIQVPPRASAGERYGVIWAEASAPDSDQNVIIINRVGVRMYLSIGAGGEPPTAFRIDDVVAGRTIDGQPYLRASVTNTGKRALDLNGTAALSEGPGGLSTGQVPVPDGTTVGLGRSTRVTVPFDRALPDGPWTARLTLASGTVHKVRTVRVTFPAGPGERRLKGERSSLLPVVLMAGGVGAVAAVALSLVAARRRQRYRPRRGGQESRDGDRDGQS
ncbi:DUF916 domain-containing protein, partial [Frankia nepalensis]|uniref:DUF916 domain-containing protein n=1 Tax=Frankia nepalensis TaxID=1836974 RepID=UPI001EE4CBC4